MTATMENYGYWDCEDCPLCAEGQAQSPINLTGAQRCTTDHDITFDYQPMPLRVTNNGNTIRVDCVPGSYMVYDSTRYDLVQFHFHCPGEHQIDGQSYAIELHLVHQSTEGVTAVIGVMIVRGNADNPAYAALWSRMPTEPGETRSYDNVHINAADLLPASLKPYYHYEGSLTTPPCTEGIRWFVLETPVTLSSGQVATFEGLYNGNSRPLCDLNGRVIYRHE